MSTCRFFRCCERAALHSVSSVIMAEEIPGRNFFPSGPNSSSSAAITSNEIIHKLKKNMKYIRKRVNQNSIGKEPLFPLLRVALDATAVDAVGIICLSACARNDLASSLSFLSLAITRQAASCWEKINVRTGSY